MYPTGTLSRGSPQHWHHWFSVSGLEFMPQSADTKPTLDFECATLHFHSLRFSSVLRSFLFFSFYFHSHPQARTYLICTQSNGKRKEEIKTSFFFRGPCAVWLIDGAHGKIQHKELMSFLVLIGKSIACISVAIASRNPCQLVTLEILKSIFIRSFHLSEQRLCVCVHRDCDVRWFVCSLRFFRHSRSSSIHIYFIFPFLPSLRSIVCSVLTVRVQYSFTRRCLICKKCFAKTKPAPTEIEWNM